MEQFVKLDNALSFPDGVANVIIGNTPHWWPAVKIEHADRSILCYIPAADGACGFGHELAARGQPVGPWYAWAMRHYDALLPAVYAKGKTTNRDETYRQTRVIADAAKAAKALRSIAAWCAWNLFDGVFCDNARLRIDGQYDVAAEPRPHPENLELAIQHLRAGWAMTRRPAPRVVLNLSDPWTAFVGGRWLSGDAAPLHNAEWLAGLGVEVYLEMLDLRKAETAAFKLTQVFVKEFTAHGGRLWLQLANADSPNGKALLAAAGENVIRG